MESNRNSSSLSTVSRRGFVVAGGLAFGALLATKLGVSSQGIAGEAAATASEGASAAAQEGYPLTVTDLSGYEVTVEAEPQSVGALLGNSYEHIFFLGAADRVSCRMKLGTNAWMKVVDPEFDSYPTVEFEASSCRQPNVEELVNLDVDVVFYWADLAEQKENMEGAGITVVESNPSGVEFTTVDEWRKVMKDEMDLYATVLGGDAPAKAQKWNEYVNEKVEFVLDRTKDLTEDERPRVYCIRNQEDGLQCFAKSSYFSMMAEAAGATLVTKDVDTNKSGFTTVTIEDVATWDPEYVFMGWLDDPAVISENEQWASVAAVKEGNVFTLPCSLNSTDWAYYAESPLELLYVAKTVHPDLFDDVDMLAEIETFYQEFYGVELTDEQAQAMIDRKDPDGVSNDNF